MNNKMLNRISNLWGKTISRTGLGSLFGSSNAMPKIIFKKTITNPDELFKLLAKRGDKLKEEIIIERI